MLTVLLIGYVVLAAVWIACLIDAVFMGSTISAINRRIGQRIFEAIVGLRGGQLPGQAP